MTDLKFPPSSDESDDSYPEWLNKYPSQPDDKFPGDDRQEPQEPKEQWVFNPDCNKELYKKATYKMACLIMGCLVLEEVVQTADHDDLGSSDMAVGIRIIAKCLEGNLLDKFLDLPFDY